VVYIPELAFAGSLTPPEAPGAPVVQPGGFRPLRTEEEDYFFPYGRPPTSPTGMGDDARYERAERIILSGTDWQQVQVRRPSLLVMWDWPLVQVSAGPPPVLVRSAIGARIEYTPNEPAVGVTAYTLGPGGAAGMGVHYGELYAGIGPRQVCLLMSPGNWWVRGSLLSDIDVTVGARYVTPGAVGGGGGYAGGTLHSIPCLLLDARQPSMASRFLAEDGFSNFLTGLAGGTAAIAIGATPTVTPLFRDNFRRKLLFIQVGTGGTSTVFVCLGSPDVGIAAAQWRAVAMLSSNGASFTLSGSTVWKGPVGVTAGGAIAAIQLTCFEGMD